MVHLQALPGRRCAHEGAVPAGGTLLAGVVRFRRRSPGERGQQRGGAQPAPNGGEPEDQRRDPFGAGKRNQEYPRFLVRHMALARLQPLPCPELHPLPTPTRPSLNSYGGPDTGMGSFDYHCERSEWSNVPGQRKPPPPFPHLRAGQAPPSRGTVGEGGTPSRRLTPRVEVSTIMACRFRHPTRQPGKGGPREFRRNR